MHDEHMHENNYNCPHCDKELYWEFGMNIDDPGSLPDEELKVELKPRALFGCLKDKIVIKDDANVDDEITKLFYKG